MIDHGVSTRAFAESPPRTGAGEADTPLSAGLGVLRHPCEGPAPVHRGENTSLIGFQVKLPASAAEPLKFTPSVVNRIAMIDAELGPSGHRLFIYSPGQVRADRATVPGYLHEAGRFLPVTAPVPKVNGNWTRRTRRVIDGGMGYHEFQRWAEDQGVAIYVPPALCDLLANKHDTYRLVYAYNATLHPHCEVCDLSTEQLERFIESGRLTFVKPRRGSRGNRIVVIERTPAGFAISQYDRGERRHRLTGSIKDARKCLVELTRGRIKYVMEHGIETMPFGGSTFDVRVIMVNDGRSWRWLHEARLSKPGSHVSNVAQGGESVPTDELMFELLGTERGLHMMREIRSESFGLVGHLDRRFPGSLHELAFDFAIDREGRLKLLEINTKPGLSSVGFDFTVWNKRPEHEPIFERWVYPHGKSLARFLLSKTVVQGAS